MRKFCALWILFSLPCVAAAPKAPAIAMSRQIVCGIAAWSGIADKPEVRCWDLAAGGKELALPLLPMETPVEIAVSERRVCVRETGRLRCWDFQSAKPQELHFFDKLTNPLVVAGGSRGDFCAYDQSGSYQSHRLYCTALGTSANPFIHPYSMAIGSGQQICVLQQASGHAIDCLVAFDSVAAGCAENLKKIYFEDPDMSRIVVARGAKPDCQACTIGNRHVHCWGDGHEPDDTRPYPQPFHRPSHLAFLTVPALAPNRQIPCVLDGGKVLCAARPEKFQAYPLLGDFAGARALDGVDDRFCAMNDEEWRCQVDGKPLRIYHGLELRFSLDHYEATLVHLAERIYRDKGELLRAVVKALGDHADADLRHFALLAAAEVIDDIHTDPFEQTVQPRLHHALAEITGQDGKSRLGDFAPAPALVVFALETAHAALDALSHDSPAAHERFQDLNVALGNALATRGDAGSLAELHKQYLLRKKEFDTPASTAARLLRALLEFLTPG